MKSPDLMRRINLNGVETKEKPGVGCLFAGIVIIVVVALMIAENYLGIFSGCDKRCKDHKIEQSSEEFSRLPLSEQSKIIEEIRQEEKDDSYRGW